MCFTSLSLFAQTFTGGTGPITDNNCDVTHDFPVTVSGVGVLGTTNNFSTVGFSITHTWDSDLDIFLIAPDGITIVELSTDNGGTGDNYTNTVISADGTTAITAGTAPFTGTYTPEGSLAVLNGINADGTWILRICDDAAGDVGTLNSSSITFVPVIFDLPDYVNLQFPFTASIAQGGNVTVYGQVYEGGLTDVAPNIVGQAPGISAWVGISPIGSDTNPNTWTTWIPATWNSGAVGNNDEYQASIGSTLVAGTYYYATRFRLNGGAYVYGGTNNIWNGTSAINGVLTVTPPPAPANDDCSGAISLTVNPDYNCGTVRAGTILAATASATDATACGGTEDDDVWYSFVATATSQRISLLNVAGSTTDLYHSLWTGADCNSLTLVPGTCSDPNTSNPTGLVIGQTYYVRVYSWTATTGQTTTFNICIGTPPSPPDYVNLQSPSSAAIPSGGSVTVYGQIYEAGLTDTTVGSAAAGILAWVGISPVGSNTNPNTWTNWVPATFNVESGNNDEYQAAIGSTLASGTYYYATRFQLNGGAFVYGGIDVSNNGNFWDGTTYLSGVLTVSPPPAPANDDCSGAIALTPGGVFADSVVDGTMLGATLTAGITPTCQTSNIADVWYTVVVPASGNLTIETQVSATNSLADTVVVAFSGTCGALVQVGCDDDGGPAGVNSLMSLLSLTGQTPGSTLYVGVWKYGTDAPTPVVSGFKISAYDGSLGNSSFDNSNFSYYPNPVKNTLNLSYNQEISSVEVFNLLGQKVSSNNFNANTAQIEMSNLSKGAYMVRVTSNNQVKTIKVIKE